MAEKALFSWFIFPNLPGYFSQFTEFKVGYYRSKGYIKRFPLQKKVISCKMITVMTYLKVGGRFH